MYRRATSKQGFTIVEILIIIAVIGILAAIMTVSYNGAQKHAAQAAMFSDLENAAIVIEQYGLKEAGSFPDSAYLRDNFKNSPDIVLTIADQESQNAYYASLSPVQNGVLLYDICAELMKDPLYTTIHSSNGSQTEPVQLACDDDVAEGSLQITALQTMTWPVPLQKPQLTNYINSVPYDNWWTDRQAVVRGFYQTLISTFESRGGTWPITSFWDPWANQWSGVQKEELPPLTEPNNLANKSYCVEATHLKYPDLRFITTSDKTRPHAGNC